MKLNDLKNIAEGSNEDETVKKAPAPGKMGDLITSAQAAKILGVEMSRIRQLAGEGELESHQPEEGRRDHFFKRADVEAYKSKEKDKGGRPEKKEDAK